MDKGNYRVFWRFVIDPAHRDAFLAGYAEDGEWSGLFRENAGYIATHLFQSASEPDTWLTVDLWRSRADYEAFRKENHARYEAMDQRFQRCTVEETFLGDVEEKPA